MASLPLATRCTSRRLSRQVLVPVQVLTRPFHSTPTAPSPLPSWLTPSPPPLPSYRAHIPLHPWQKHLLSLGSALASLNNPARGDMIATLSETSGEAYLPSLRDGMAASAEGRAVLAERPRITSRSIEVGKLQGMGEGTFGREYAEWMEWCRVGPDTRAQVSTHSGHEGDSQWPSLTVLATTPRAPSH